ncbi:MAG TPA: phosphoribosyl-ATP diphosphatase [Nevskiaceae bacterium]|nr:phosphoribosyl-ATP diphosphatase [Nevskiaceae bacterium]
MNTTTETHDPGAVLAELYATLEARRGADPNQSYVASLYKRGIDVILKKVGEEASETIIAAKNPDDNHLVYELADLWFHTLVLMAARRLPLNAVTDELARRFGRSGLEEKASRPK